MRRGLGNPSLILLRALAQASARLSREALYHSLSPKGNPTLKTLVAVLKPIGLRFSVVPAPAKPKRATNKSPSCRKSLRKAS